MKELFKAEVLRFRNWALAAGAANAVALGFMSRVVDLAQQPRLVYHVLGIVCVVLGALLGLYQMGTYRRPSQWLNLLHRPLHRLAVALGLCGAGAALLAVAVLLPIALVAGYQELLTARVVDLRHWLLPVAAFLLALCGYLAGAYAMLASRRWSVAVFLLPTLLLFAQAHGVRALALQLLVLAWLALLVGIAFRPSLDEAPRNPGALLATALPVQAGAYFLLWMLGFGYELAWTAAGSHPLNSPDPPSGGFIEAARAEPKDRLLAGIAGSRDPDAPLWREQVSLSDVAVLYPLREVMRRHQLTNGMQPPEFDDPQRPVRWVFSHDRMRFVGHGIADKRARGELGLGADHAAFPGPVLPYANDLLFAPGAAYQYDAEQRQVVPRVVLPAGEVFATPPEAAGENLAVISDRALYFYPGREAAGTLDLLQPLLRVPLPGPIGHLTSVELVELLDGYLVSFTFTNGAWAGEATPRQQVLRVAADGTVAAVARRELGADLPLAYTMRTWWLSPVLRTLCLAAQDLFAAPNPLDAGAIPAPPRRIVLLAAALCLLSLLGAVWVTARQAHSRAARLGWVLACGAVGMPALASLWLLYPPRERTDELPLAHGAAA